MEKNKDNDKPMVNLQDFKDQDVTCADCEKTLLRLVQVRSSEKKYKVIVKCPFCEGQSWLTDLVGDYFKQPAKKLRIGEIEEEEDNVLLVTMERQ